MDLKFENKKEVSTSEVETSEKLNMKPDVSKFAPIKFFCLTLIIAWTFWIPMALNKFQIISFEIPIILGQALGAFSPLMTLLIIEKNPKNDINTDEIFFKKQGNKPNFIWYLLAIFTIPCVTIMANFVNYLIGNTNQFTILNQNILETVGLGLILVIPVHFISCSLFSSPLMEEPGWRGYGLGKLQAKFGTNLGSLILGTFWWVWHMPLNIALSFDITIYSYLTMVAHSFIADSIYNGCNKRLLAAMFCHQSMAHTFIYILGAGITGESFTPFLKLNIYPLHIIIALWVVVFIFRIFEKIRKKEIKEISKSNFINNDENFNFNK